MSVVKIVEKPELYPGVTPLLRKSDGPVAYLGELITNVHVFLTEQEVEEAAVAFGWLRQFDVAVLEAENESLRAKVAELTEEIEPLRELAKASDRVFRARRTKLNIPA